MKRIIYLLTILIIVVAGIYFLFQLLPGDKFEGISPGPQPQAQPQQQAVPKFEQLEATILQQGSGAVVKNEDTVIVHYVGVLENGTKFDSSVDRGQPFSFTVGAGSVIAGWDLGLVGMKVGEIRRLYIPSELGYGEAGAGNGAIPANANLIFEIQLLEISA